MARMLQALKNLEARAPRSAPPDVPAKDEPELASEQPPIGSVPARALWTVERLAAALQLPELASQAPASVELPSPAVAPPAEPVALARSEAGSQEPGTRGQEPGVREQESGARSLASEDRDYETSGGASA